jgi:hypothetical protein
MHSMLNSTAQLQKHTKQLHTPSSCTQPNRSMRLQQRNIQTKQLHAASNQAKQLHTRRAHLLTQRFSLMGTMLTKVIVP